MASLNKVFLMGNLTKNPELRYTPGNVAVCEFSIAINRNIPLQNGQQKTETTFVPIQVWGKNAETVSRFLQKGSSVLIDGSLKYESWEKDGKQYNKILVIGNSVQFLNKSSGTNKPDKGQNDHEHKYNEQDAEPPYQQPPEVYEPDDTEPPPF